jgi:cellobiose dehydrogenase (acceptor)
MTLSQYLGRGSVSRGRLTITSGLTMTVSKAPYLHDQGDIDAVIAGISHLQDVLSNVPNLTFTSPAPGQDAAEYVEDVSIVRNNLI